ncbi:ATP-binding protein [Kitasatospora xanthocidica]|uniref:ATP-binding protein n=2 Tax=Kitasatospora xanthocidica TaxID=83382 RepID=A0A372ZKH5_9ACTN|nr:ATP-binding protein [Kitasatospora xanthocidica]
MTPAGPAVSAPLWEELFMSTGTALAVDPHVVTCTLAPRFEAVRTARDFARSTLQLWGLTELFDDVALVASELVTNALRHAIGARPDPSGGALGEYDFPMKPTADGRLPIRISLVHRAPQVVCAVSDPSSTGPVAREADFVAESGRGLHLVESFSRSWGWHPLGSGKVVWAMFEAESVGGSPLDGHSGLGGRSPLDGPVDVGGRHRRSA